MFPRFKASPSCPVSSLCVSRDVSVTHQSQVLEGRFALREQGCFLRKSMKEKICSVRSA